MFAAALCVNETIVKCFGCLERCCINARSFLLLVLNDEIFALQENPPAIDQREICTWNY